MSGTYVTDAGWGKGNEGYSGLKNGLGPHSTPQRQIQKQEEVTSALRGGRRGEKTASTKKESRGAHSFLSSRRGKKDYLQKEGKGAATG